MLLSFKNYILLLLIILAHNNSFASTNEQIITNIGASFAKIDKAVINFVQTDAKGGSTQGILFLEKPYHFRCNYFPPYPLLIVGGKKYLSVYDYEMQTLSRATANQNIISILMQKNWQQNELFQISNVAQKDNYNVLSITYNKGQEQALLYFNNQLQLIRIEILELGSVSISIHFGPLQKVKSFAAGVFQIKSPQIFGPLTQLTKEQIEQLYESY
jgi:outer membrane lipoprotein-sorting protein